MATIAEKLARIKNRRTAYELVILSPDGSKYLVAYCCQRSRSGLYVALNHRLTELKSLTSHPEIYVYWCQKAAQGAWIGEPPVSLDDASSNNAWRVYWSGRTQHASIIGGELPYICDSAVKGGAQ